MPRRFEICNHAFEAPCPAASRPLGVEHSATNAAFLHAIRPERGTSPGVLWKRLAALDSAARSSNRVRASQFPPGSRQRNRIGLFERLVSEHFELTAEVLDNVNRFGILSGQAFRRPVQSAKGASGSPGRAIVHSFKGDVPFGEDNPRRNG